MTKRTPPRNACLFVITDDFNEDYTYFSYLLNYFNKKLKDLDIYLSKTLFLSHLHADDLKKQIDLLLNQIQTNEFTYLILTTTNQKQDYLLDNNLATGQNGRIFLLRNQAFFNQLAVLFDSIAPELGTYINADYLVYNFENISKKDTQDLDFLKKKINLKNFHLKLANSLKCIEKCLLKSNYKQTCISFNGGKDCCVVLYLVYAVALKLAFKFPLHLLIINIMHSFEEMDFFIEKVVKEFYKSSIEFILFDDTSKSLKQCLAELKELRPDVESIFMGTRRTDGSYFNSMPEFAPTDADWPRYMRVNPILDWTYSEIWYFIRLINLPYCSLYDKGYTSLDNSLNTVPNRALLKEDGSYLPAYLLENEQLERESRRKYAKNAPAAASSL